MISTIFRRNRTPRVTEAPKHNGTKSKGESPMRELEAFPSPTFQTEVRSAAERIAKIRVDIEALQEHLPKLRRNSEALEVAGKNPADEIAKTVAQISEAERELSRARGSMLSLFSAEQNRYTAVRRQVWENSYLATVDTARSQFASLSSTLRKMSEQLVALRSAPVAGTVSSSNLDAGVAALNALAAEHKLPSNFSISTNSSLSHSFGHAVCEMLKAADIDAALKELRENLESLGTKQPVSQFDPTFASAPGSRKLWAV
jgi:chromosome segregation ATPase